MSTNGGACRDMIAATHPMPGTDPKWSSGFRSGSTLALRSVKKLDRQYRQTRETLQFFVRQPINQIYDAQAQWRAFERGQITVYAFDAANCNARQISSIYAGCKQIACYVLHTVLQQNHRISCHVFILSARKSVSSI